MGTKSNKMGTRFLSFMLVVIMALSMIPTALFSGSVIPAQAADVPPAVIRVDFDAMHARMPAEPYYTSPGLGERVRARCIPLQGTSNQAFCVDHGRRLDFSAFDTPKTLVEAGNTDSGHSLATNISAAVPYLSYFYYSTDMVGTPDGFESVDAQTMTAVWVQSILWLALEGKLTGDAEAVMAIAATERDAVIEKIFGTPPDPNGSWTSTMHMNMIMTRYNAGEFDGYEFRIYQGDRKDVNGKPQQRMLYGYKPVEAKLPVYVKIQKQDGSSAPLAGAEFGVYSATGQLLGTFISGAGQWSVSGQLLVDPGESVLTIKEISPPPPPGGGGFYQRDPIVANVTVNTNIHSTAATAAEVSYIFKNKITSITAGAPIYKVDSATGAPIEGAQFQIQGLATSGNTINRSATSNSGGAVVLQWDNPGGADYIEPGYYNVRETSAASGYVLNPADQWIEFTLEWDPIGEVYIPLTSGPITFNNSKEHTVVLQKVDESNTPIGGATFNIFRNGTPLHMGVVVPASGMVIPATESGVYMFEEVAPPPGHILPMWNRITSVYVDVTDTTVDTHRVTVKNYTYPDITILKEDAVTGERLEGAEFVVSIDATVLGSFTTNTAGKITITYEEYGDFLTPGNTSWTVTAKEYKAPGGYLLSSEPTQTNEIREGQTLSTFTFANHAYPKIVINKYDAKTNDLLAGATYDVQINATSIGSFITDEFGQIIIDYETYGGFLPNDTDSGWTVTVTETSPPSGYFPPNWGEETQTVQMFRDQDLTPLVFKNEPYPEIVIIKQCAQTGLLLSGAQYEVYIDDTLLGNFVTNDDGEIRIAYEEYGDFVLNSTNSRWTLKVTEVKAPDGYFLPDYGEDTQIIEIVKGQVLSPILFKNEPYPGITVHKIDKVTNRPLAGAVFSVWLNGHQLSSMLTNDNGVFTIDFVDIGQYVDADAPGFTLRVVEETPPHGYLLSTPNFQEVWVTKGQDDVPLVFANEPKPTLTLTKIDSVTGDPLEGVKFAFYKDGLFLYEKVTGADGIIKLEGIELGTYTVKEVSTLPGYVLGTEEKVIEVKADDGIYDYTVRFENRPKSAIVVWKEDADDGTMLQGAKFELRYLGGASGTGGTVIGQGTTSTNGSIVWSNLEPGTYVVEEVKAPEGYDIVTGTETVYLGQDEQDVVTVTFYNKKHADFVLLKQDAITKQPLAGAEFLITLSDGSVLGTQGGRFTTDAQGLITLRGLPRNATLLVQEVKSPDGYILDSQIRTVNTKHGETYSLIVENTAQPIFELIKIDEATKAKLSGAEFEITHSNGQRVGTYTTDAQGSIIIRDLAPGHYVAVETEAPSGYVINPTPIPFEMVASRPTTITVKNTCESYFELVKVDASTGAKLSGAEFEIRKQNGQYHGTYTTDKNGLIRIYGMDNGWYTAKEVSAPKGYALEEDLITFEVKAGEVTVLKVKNTAESGILIVKVDSVTKNPIPGARFLLSDSKRNPIGVFTSDDKGRVLINTGLSEGKYYIEEVEAPNGYIKDTQERSVHLIYGATTTITWENSPSMGQIQIRKISGDYNETNGLPEKSPLAGATFGIYNYRNGALVSQMVSGADGWAVSNPLPLGQYIIKELTAPSYYKLSTEELLVTVEYPNQILKYEFINYSANLNVSIRKTGVKEAIVGSNITYTFYDIQNRSSTALTDFYWRDSLPSQVRANYITTGTYSTQLKYDVIVTTSAGRTITAAGNLSTVKNNYVDLKAGAIGLMSGEYVTTVTLVFGQVPSGFAQVLAPQMNVKVEYGLPNASTFVNKADIGGKNGGEWIITDSKWTTAVYNPNGGGNSGGGNSGGSGGGSGGGRLPQTGS